MEKENKCKIGNIFISIGNFLYKYRYIIGIIILVFMVYFEFSGSSIGCWATYLASEDVDTGVIWGKSRGIRSDEWAVSTPFMISQSFNNYNWISNIFRGGNTEVFTIYGLPINNIAELYRIFQIGYVIFGSAKGLSLYWFARLIFLFLVTFDFDMLITKKNKLLSFLGAMLLTFSPQVQWWFGTNGMAELFIFGQLALIALYKYMNTSKVFVRILCLLAMILSAGNYIMILYPAYQIPLFYVFLILAIWIIIKNYKNCKIKIRDVIFILISIAILALSLFYIFSNSIDTIKILLNTAYPGARVETGGRAFGKYISYIENIFFTLGEADITLSEGNICDMAMMFGLFPIGFIILIINYIKEKKIDLLSALLIIPYIIIALYSFVGFPELIAKVTFLSYSTAIRALIAVGYIDILILLRALSNMKDSVKWWKALIISLITSAVIVFLVKEINEEYLNTINVVILLVMCIALFYFALRFKLKSSKFIFTILIIVVMFFTGVMVNPLRQGINILTDTELVQRLYYNNSLDSGTWLLVGIDFELMPNYFTMAGLSVLNATNMYPNVEVWKLLDEDSKYEYIYNRYAHIKVDLVKSEDEYEEKFELLSNDTFKVYVTVDELELLNIKYIFVPRNLEEFSNENVSFEYIDYYEPYCTYKVIYNSNN